MHRLNGVDRVLMTPLGQPNERGAASERGGAPACGDGTGVGLGFAFHRIADHSEETRMTAIEDWVGCNAALRSDTGPGVLAAQPSQP
jgi:hypothetical protein